MSNIAPLSMLRSEAFVSLPQRGAATPRDWNSFFLERHVWVFSRAPSSAVTNCAQETT